MNIQENISLQKLNTFGINVTAKYFTNIASKEDLQTLANTDLFKNNEILMLGGGSNVLFTKNFDGLVIKNEIEEITVETEDEESIHLQVGSGVNWHQFVLYCIDKSYAGIENLSLIPGCVGACPIQNIGAYGVEIKQVITAVTFYNIEKNVFETYDNASCEFGYRDSIFKQTLKGKFFITAVSFKLNKKPNLNTSYGAIQAELDKQGITSPTIKDISNVVIAIRSSKLPNPAEIGNAGSFFKNPSIANAQYESLKSEYLTIVGYPNKDGQTTKLAAGWLIEQAGLKGVRVGNTGCHAMQALVLVNYGGATGQEILNYSQTVIDTVSSKFGVTLEREVNII